MPKSKKNIRRKADYSSDDGAEDNTNTASRLGNAAETASTRRAEHKKLKKGKKKIKPPARSGLSFTDDGNDGGGSGLDGDDEFDGLDPVFRVKKSKASRRMARGIELGAILAGSEVEKTASGGSERTTYDATALAELRASQMSLPDALKPAADATLEDSCDGGDGEGPSEFEKLAVTQARRHRMVGKANGKAPSSASFFVDRDNSYDGSGGGASAQSDRRNVTAIELVQRRGGVGSADQAKSFLSFAGSHDDRVLAGMEDEDDIGGLQVVGSMGGDVNIEFQLGGSGKSHSVSDDDVGDDENVAILAEWEAEAVRRGNITKANTNAPPSSSLTSSPSSIYGHSVSHTAVSHVRSVSPSTVDDAASLQELKRSVASVIEQAEDAVERNERKLERMHTEAQELDRRFGPLTVSDGRRSAALGLHRGNEEALEAAEKEELADRFRYFQSLGRYVGSLVGCMREKASQTKELHDVIQSAVIDAAATRRERRKEAQDDVIRELMSPPGGGSGSLVLLDLGGYRLPSEGGSEESREGTGGDELGRDRSYSMRGQVEARRNLRERRRRRAWRRVGGADYVGKDTESSSDDEEKALPVLSPEDVLSSEDESDRERVARLSRRRTLIRAARTVLSDVSSAYATLGAVRTALEEWRERYRHEYRAAYVSQSLPAILAPLAEVELAEWELLWNGLGATDSLRAAVAMAKQYADVDGEGRGGADENQVSEQQGDREEEVDSGNDEANSGGTTQEIMRSQAAFYHADVGSCVFPLTDLIWIGELAEFASDDDHRRAGGEDACSQLEKEEGLDGEEWGAPQRAVNGSVLPLAVLSDMDPDSSLLPRMVAATVLPRVVVRLREAYDPFSRCQTRIFVGCVAELLEFFSVVNSDGIAASAQSQRRNEHEQSLAELLAAPLKPLTAATRALCVPIMPFDSSSSSSVVGGGGSRGSGSRCSGLSDASASNKGRLSAGEAFVLRQICFGVKLLRNMSAWAALLDDPLGDSWNNSGSGGGAGQQASLAALAVKSLVADKLAPGLLHLARLGHTEQALTLTERLAASLPPRLDAFRKNSRLSSPSPSSPFSPSPKSTTSWQTALHGDDVQGALAPLVSTLEEASAAVAKSNKNFGGAERAALLRVRFLR